MLHLTTLLWMIGGLSVAAANGANDNFKGVSTLFGSGAAGYRASLGWATAATFAGSMVAVFLGARLSAAFSGGGLLPAGIAATPALMSAVAIGAALTVALASRWGLPVSTTHALLGALLGAGAVAGAGRLNLGVLAERFVAPLLLSPVLAFLVAALAYPALRGAGRRGFSTPAHFLTAGLQSFARGLNDTPKIAALLVGVAFSGASLPPALAVATVAAAMAVGGWLGSRRVGETMSHRITALSEGQALTSNAVTAILVLAASTLALPVSMTHVAVGSLAGPGTIAGGVRWATLRTVVLSWIATLPLAAALAAIAFVLTGRMTH